MRLRIRFTFVAAALTAATALAQTAQSPNYQLIGFEFSGGGGASNATDVTWGSTRALGGHAASANFEADVGLFASVDPGPSDNPAVFAVTPGFGSKAGGVAITVHGFNFDKLGVGPSATVTIGGVLCTGVSVLSNTTLTATTGAGSPGPQSVVVTTSLGAGTLGNGFVNTPALLTPIAVELGDALHFSNLGPVGATYFTFASSTTQFFSSLYGPFLIGPAPLVTLYSNQPYPAPDGAADDSIVVPPLALLHDATVYFQSFALTNVAPVHGAFTNATATLLQ